MKKKFTKQYKKDIKKINPNNTLKNLIDDITDKIINNITIDSKYNLHKLKGNLSDYYELHLYPDLLLLYKLDRNNNSLTLARIGSHSELFKKWFN